MAPSCSLAKRCRASAPSRPGVRAKTYRGRLRRAVFVSGTPRVESVQPLALAMILGGPPVIPVQRKRLLSEVRLQESTLEQRFFGVDMSLRSVSARTADV
jgi:hypothetical protein